MESVVGFLKLHFLWKRRHAPRLPHPLPQTQRRLHRGQQHFTARAVKSSSLDKLSTIQQRDSDLIRLSDLVLQEEKCGEAHTREGYSAGKLLYTKKPSKTL